MTPLEFLEKFGSVGSGSGVHNPGCSRGAHVRDLGEHSYWVDGTPCRLCRVTICDSVHGGLGCTREKGHLGLHENRWPPHFKFGKTIETVVPRASWRWS